MKIGVTGIFASGKGTVCGMFGELGAKVIDTDELAREVQKPGTKGLKNITDVFGKEMLNADGSLNRKKLANSVFNDPEKVKKLERIVHPLILKKMEEIISKDPDQIYVINVPLLFETDFHKKMDYTITVTVKEEQAVNRGIIRDNITEKEIKERLNNQISLNEKIKLSDYFIDNSGSVLNTKRQVLKIWTILIQEKEE